MRYGLTWIVVVMLISALVGVAVGDRGEQPERVPETDATPEARPARTPQPPSVGGGSVTANPPEVTPSPEPTATPVEEAEVTPPRIATPQPAPAETVEQALEVQTDARTASNGEAAGSIPAESSTPTPAPAATTLREAIAASDWPPETHAKVYRVVMCESSGRTTALSPAGYVGLMQVAPWLHGPVPADAVGQLNDGYEVYIRQGWGAWPVCQHAN